MLSIDEAIAHAREVAAIQRNNDKLNKTLGVISPYYKTDCIKCAEEHEQLKEWLEELQNLKAENTYLHDEMQAIGATMGLIEKEIRNKAIDGFVQEIRKAYDSMKSIPSVEKATANTIALGIAEKLMEGGIDGNEKTDT